MAVLDAILVPATLRGTKVVDLAAVNSTAEILIGHNVLLAVNADQDITIRWGPTGMGAADDTDFRVPQGVTIVFDMGRDKDYVRFFNRSATTAADIWYLPLSKF